MMLCTMLILSHADNPCTLQTVIPYKNQMPADIPFRSKHSCFHSNPTLSNNRRTQTQDRSRLGDHWSSCKYRPSKPPAPTQYTIQMLTGNLYCSARLYRRSSRTLNSNRHTQSQHRLFLQSRHRSGRRLRGWLKLTGLQSSKMTSYCWKSKTLRPMRPTMKMPPWKPAQPPLCTST